eukprot:CAMPEP_0118933284 /NCGR_PEP_ID=MMETSP1169-20130426/11889_1 /TAXON_ID=36882 /ORGANISM="Pyramimonas obovata, Strain CCMP722" /LENGTH=179 /DNA_ID=CAMNT_0006876023 /DNA_START=151 /DNA_END=691 /DNA_ORIENTATION=+
MNAALSSHLSREPLVASARPLHSSACVYTNSTLRPSKRVAPTPTRVCYNATWLHNNRYTKNVASTCATRCRAFRDDEVIFTAEELARGSKQVYSQPGYEETKSEPEDSEVKDSGDEEDEEDDLSFFSDTDFSFYTSDLTQVLWLVKAILPDLAPKNNRAPQPALVVAKTIVPGPYFQGT